MWKAIVRSSNGEPSLNSASSTRLPMVILIYILIFNINTLY